MKAAKAPMIAARKVTNSGTSTVPAPRPPHRLVHRSRCRRLPCRLSPPASPRPVIAALKKCVGVVVARGGDRVADAVGGDEQQLHHDVGDAGGDEGQRQVDQDDAGRAARRCPGPGPPARPRAASPAPSATAISAICPYWREEALGASAAASSSPRSPCTTCPISQLAPSATQVVIWLKTPLPTPLQGVGDRGGDGARAPHR